MVNEKRNSNILNVFRFSVIQNMKNKVFIILTLVCGLLMFVLTPTMIYMSEEMTSSKDSTIKKVYIIDENKILNNTKIISKKGSKIEEFHNIKFYLVDDKFDIYKKKFAEDKNNKSSLLIQATNERNMYKLNIFKLEKTDITDTDLSIFSEQIAEFYNDNKVINMDLDTNSYILVNTPVNVNVHVAGENDSDKQSEITIVMIVMMVVMLFIVLSGENISTQIVTEKSTKLVEFLLVNIRPLDLVCGKVLASVLVSFIQLLVMVGSGLLSIVMCKNMGIIDSYEDTLSLLKLGKFTDDISAPDILIILLILIIGFLFYAIIACMLSSTVSRLEDLSNVQMIYSLIILLVVYAIMGVMTINDYMDTGHVIYKALIVIPFSSVFITPQFIMLGKMGMEIYIIAIAVQLLCLIVFGKIASKIYVSLIMYSGKKLSIKQVWNIINNKKVGDTHE